MTDPAALESDLPLTRIQNVLQTARTTSATSDPVWLETARDALAEVIQLELNRASAVFVDDEDLEPAWPRSAFPSRQARALGVRDFAAQHGLEVYLVRDGVAMFRRPKHLPPANEVLAPSGV